MIFTRLCIAASHYWFECEILPGCLSIAAARGVALGRVVEITVEGMGLYRNIYLARNRRQPLARAQAKFWKYINLSKSEIPKVLK